MALQLPREWRWRQERYRLIGGRCRRCGQAFFPHREICPRCLGEDVAKEQFSGRGRVYSYATVYKAPVGFEEYVPYVVALVQLEEGALVAAQLTDVDPTEVQIGMPVECVLRRWRTNGPDGNIIYGYKFRPRLES